jgi:hypothetical protein
MRHLSPAERLGMAEARAARLESRMLQQDKLIEELRRQIDAITAALRGMPAHNEPKLPVPLYRRRMADIAAAVALANDLTVTELKSADRTARIAWPRQEAMLAMQEEGFSLPQIGRFFKRDHTTVLHGVRAAKLRMGAALPLQPNCDGGKMSGSGGATNAIPDPDHRRSVTGDRNDG